jgi:uncharacterized protein (DUF1800 family)
MPLVASPSARGQAICSTFRNWDSRSGSTCNFTRNASLRTRSSKPSCARRAVYSNRQLEEVLAGFLVNHFNVFLDKGADHYLVTEYEREAIRPHVLGKFRDLLEATAKSPAMLFYLDNWESVGASTPAAFAGGPNAPARAE